MKRNEGKRFQVANPLHKILLTKLTRLDKFKTRWNMTPSWLQKPEAREQIEIRSNMADKNLETTLI